MKRYILTGAPSAGKTVLLRRLEAAGHAVVEEAATDIHVLAFARGITDPGKEPSFIADIVELQCSRQHRADAWPEDVVVFDRSPICTLALCEFAGLAPPATLVAELDRIQREAVYERGVFFVENLGFVAPTEVRRISFEGTLEFEAVHTEVYRRLGYELISVPVGDLETRFQQVAGVLSTAI
ncbi:MAG TPA: AAA family ATPase [Caulobacteraceae bacterium]|jgi:predicted ATPase